MGKKKQRQTAPAEGERAAIGGYHPQYRLSADTILQSLRYETMEWIRLADPTAGRVDDFQIGTPGRVDGYQVKWSRDGGSFTFRDLTTPEANKPCLIAQLADGWATLRRNNSNRRAVVHLRTNETPSVTKLLDRVPGVAKGSFSEFLNQVWYPAHENGNPVSGEWESIWNTLVDASSLCPADFAQFVRDCKLELGIDLPGNRDGSTRYDPIFERDLRQLTEFLQSVVADPAHVVELSRNILLDRIGWVNRLTYVSRHDFPDPTIPYREIEATANCLRVALQNVHRGYVVLLGDPGSGKSTLLTKTLLGLPYRVIRYYSFVPDTPDPRALRGEATSFLHDITLALDRAGFRSGKSISSSKDTNQLTQRFHEQLGLLYEDWRVTGRKTVILIDGLDHISRELKPHDSLLRYLPHPDQIPDGVLVVLGSQTDQLTDLPHPVHLAIQQTERRIQIERLSRESVFEIIEHGNLPVVLTSSQRIKVEELAAGHPLALALLLNRLSDLADDQTVEAIISSTEPFGGQIDEIYHSHWRQVIDDRNDNLLAALLGKLVRLRPIIDLHWIESWAGIPVVDCLRRHLYHLFRREGRHHWYIFHNSFRQFLLRRTAESPPDGFDADRDRRIHSEIADLCAAECCTSHWNWQEAYHRHCAGEHQKAVELANADRLRSQLLAYRPVDAIEGDIRMAVASAGELRDFVALVRLLFVGAEFNSRGETMASISLHELFLAIDNIEKACIHARDGRLLRLSARSAMDFSLNLATRGFHEEARLVFELAEPIDLLKNTQSEHGLHGDQIALLQSWAKTAISFRDLPEVVKLIRGMRQHGATLHQDTVSSQGILVLQNLMLRQTAEGLIDLQRWSEFELILAELGESDLPGLPEQFWLYVHAWQACCGSNDILRARQFVERACNLVAIDDLSDEGKVCLSEAILRILSDVERAKGLFEKVTPPTLTTDPGLGDRLGPYMQRFRYCRLLYAFEERRDAAELIPDALNSHYQPVVFFERGLSEIARIWAMSWRGIILNGPMFVQEAGLLLRLFCRNWNDDGRAEWSMLTRHRSRFYTLLVRAAQQHGCRAIQELAIAFENEWLESDRSRYWSFDDIRSITRSLYAAGAEATWCRNVLARTETQSNDATDTTGKLSWRESQAHSWVLIGEVERAKPLIDQILQISAGIGYRKDYQLDSWIEWMRMANQVQPDAAQARIRFLASAAISMIDSTEGDAATSAAELLLQSTFQWSPVRAVALCRLLSENGVIAYESGARIIVKSALESANPPCDICLSYCADLLIPMSTSPDGELVSAIVRRIGQIHGNEAAKQAANILLLSVNIYGLPETRYGWRRGIIEALGELAIPLDGFETAQEAVNGTDDDWPPSLKLTDGRQFSRQQISADIHTADDLISLIEAETTDSYYDWIPHIRELARHMNADEVLALEASLQLRHQKAIGIAVLAERLCDLDDRTRAMELGLKAVENASPNGWDRYYDGGTSQAAFRVLVQIDPKRGRESAFGALTEHLSGEWWYPLNIVRNLDRIAPIMCETVPTIEIWSIIEDYLNALFSEVPLIDATVLELAGGQIDSIQCALTDLACEFLGHPAHLLSEGAIRTCVHLLLAGNENIQTALGHILEHPNVRITDVLIALDAVSKCDVSRIKVFANHIDKLRCSPDQSVRWAAGRIGDRLNLPEREPQLRMNVLGLYQGRAIVPGTQPLYGGTKGSSFDILPDTCDPHELVSPFLDDIKIIANDTALPCESLLVRVVEFMRHISPESTWNAEAEEKLRHRMDQAKLEFPFRRPRSSQARRAIFHVLAELADSGQILPEHLAIFETIFRVYDADLVLRQPVVRPTNISPVMCPQYNEFKREWVEAVNDVELQPLCDVCDTRVVLAEYTILKPAGTRMPKEARRSVLVSEAMDGPSSEIDELRFFPRLIRELVASYHAVSVELEEFPAVVHWAFGYETPGDGWLALNPSLGRFLDWEPSDKGFLAWEQKSQLMVETIWWNDGLCHHSMPFYHKGEVGEGWLVVATEEAIDLIANQIGSLKRVCALTREIFEDRQRFSRTRYFNRKLTEWS